MAAALALAERGRGRTAPNPNVGCVIVRDGRMIGRGWTRPGGRPHAEAVALGQAGAGAQGATVYVTLEPCAHESARGPACADLIIAARPARVVACLLDPDPRTAGRGLARLAEAGIAVETGLLADAARLAMAGFLTRQALGRPHVTLKLATSLDGCIARADGESRWITSEAARAHAHLERSRHEAILVGHNTWTFDAPRLDVRLAGLEERAPRKLVLSHQPTGVGALATHRAEGDWDWIAAPQGISALEGVDHLLIEGGMVAASAFLAADLVDRLLLYRAPILIGGGKPGIGDVGLASLADAHGRWRLTDARQLGSDRLEAYLRLR